VIDTRLLEILRCPQDHSPLTAASAELVTRINDQIAAGHVAAAGGQQLEQAIDGGLIRAAGDLLYPIVDQIPVMLPDEAIPLGPLQSEP
jgi:uncharacterized protein YbaR (Trm112 family)